jgi:hypothetical protein
MKVKKRLRERNGPRPDVPKSPLPATFDERLAKLPPEQQQAVIALAGGLGAVLTARAVGVDRRTITRWSSDLEFQRLRREIAPSLSAAHVRVALEAFFDVMEKDRVKGRSGNIRYFLNRTVFADYSALMAKGRGTAVSVNVAQHQEQVQAKIKSVWEERRGSAPLADPE